MSSEAVRSPPLPKTTSRAAAFRNPFVAVGLGIILPLICLTFDPIVFRTTFGEPILGSYKISGYGFMVLSMLTLAAWLPIRRLPSVFCGCLFAACAFALVLGVALLPISLIGLFAIIGILGFSPFLTATTFWYCAKNAHELAAHRFKPALAVSAFVIFLAIPIGTQAYVSHITDYSMTVLIDGSNKSAEHAIRRLKMLGPVLDTDMLVWRYNETDSELARDRIASAYKQLTGSDIQDRLDRLLD